MPALAGVPRSLVCRAHTSLPRSLASLAYAPLRAVVRMPALAGVPRSLVCRAHTSLPRSLASLAYAPLRVVVRLPALAGVPRSLVCRRTLRFLAPWPAWPTRRSESPYVCRRWPACLGRSCAGRTLRFLAPWPAWPTRRSESPYVCRRFVPLRVAVRGGFGLHVV